MIRKPNDDTPDRVRTELSPRIRRRLNNDWDYWSLFTGEEGAGKSTEAIWLAHYVSGRRFSIEENMVYDSEDFLTAIYNAKKGATIILDEGGAAWYNLNYATRMNKAIDQAAMEIRERNLNIELCVPRWHYLGKVAIFRHKYRCQVYAVNEVRGYCRYLEPSWEGMEFSRSDIPFWKKKFRHRFPELPAKVLDVYRPMKRKKGEERLAKYIEIVQIDKERLCPEKRRSPQEIAAEVRKAPEKYQNTRGRADWRKIMFYFECSEPVARQAAAGLSPSP